MQREPRKASLSFRRQNQVRADREREAEQFCRYAGEYESGARTGRGQQGYGGDYNRPSCDHQ